jgi:hypothetical protein
MDLSTGAEIFTVKQIEVLEIADQIALPADVKICANGRLFQESERCRSESSRPALGDTGGRQRVGEGDEQSRRLFVADEFARQAGRVQDVQQGRGRAAGSTRRRQTRTGISAGKAGEEKRRSQSGAIANPRLPRQAA